MPREECIDSTATISRQRHEGPAEVADEPRSIFASYRSLEFVYDGIRPGHYRFHQPESTESAVADHQRSRIASWEPKLHMPQRMLREPRTSGEELRPDASSVERLAQHTNVGRFGSDAGVTKGLNDGARRAVFLPDAFVGGLGFPKRYPAT